MNFTPIDISRWSRKEYFEHYQKSVPCTYSMTLNLDISTLLKVIKKNNWKLYPTIIYLLSVVVNKQKEFRTAFDENGALGVFEFMHPCYTIFQPDSETFTSIWTEYRPIFAEFYANYLEDVQKYGKEMRLLGKPDAPANIFNVSSIPWISFTGFNLNLPKVDNYLLPIFTTGKYFEQNNQILLPLSIQVHHAVCDGYHVGKFAHDLQNLIHHFQGSTPS